MIDATQPDSHAATSIADPRLSFRWETHKHKDRQVSYIQRVLLFKMNQTDLDDKLIPAYACAWERLQNRLDRMLGNPEPKPESSEKLNGQRSRELSDKLKLSDSDPSA